MSKVIPFPALLPKHELAQRIVCPPYDVISSDFARELVRGNPCSFLRITKAEVDFPAGTSEYDERVYETAKRNYAEFLEEGWFAQDEESFYIYRIEGPGHVQTGVVCGASVDEYDNGSIKRHEKTRIAKEDDRTRFALSIGAHAEPVLFTCRSTAGFKDLVARETPQEPLYNVAGPDGTRHILWRIKGAERIKKCFGRMDSLYIADGHHRSAAASRVRRELRGGNPGHTGCEFYNYFPAVVFPHDEMRVYRYDWDGESGKRPFADVTIGDIMALADRGGIMPPKSTWFAPKLISGLFIFSFDNSPSILKLRKPVTTQVS